MNWYSHIVLFSVEFEFKHIQASTFVIILNFCIMFLLYNKHKPSFKTKKKQENMKNFKL